MFGMSVRAESKDRPEQGDSACGTGVRPGPELRYHVCYAADENFAAIAATSIVSLLTNNESICPELCIWILDNGLAKESRRKLTELCGRYSAAIRLIDAGEMTGRIKSLHVSPGNYGSFATYTRLFMPGLLPEEVERILYLDCDTLVLSDIRPLFELAMGDDQCILGIRDLVSSCDVHLFRRIGYTGNTYINAGVLLIDPRRWRQWHLTDAIFKHIEDHPNYPFLDQDLINVVCQRHIGILSPKYDLFFCCGAFSVRQLYVMYVPRKYASYFYPPDYFEAEVKDPVIVHFAGAMYFRPWVEGADGPYVSLWREYAGMTGFELALKDRAVEPVRFMRAAVALRWLPKGLYSVLFRVRREIVDRWRHRG